MGGFYVRSKVTYKSSHQSVLSYSITWHNFTPLQHRGCNWCKIVPYIYIVVVSYMGAIYMSKLLNFDAIDQLV